MRVFPILIILAVAIIALTFALVGLPGVVMVGLVRQGRRS